MGLLGEQPHPWPQKLRNLSCFKNQHAQERPIVPLDRRIYLSSTLIPYHTIQKRLSISMSDSDDLESPVFKYKRVAFKRKQPEPDSDDSDESATEDQALHSVAPEQAKCSLRAQLDADDDESSDVEIMVTKSVCLKRTSVVECSLDSDDEVDILPVKPFATDLYFNENLRPDSIQALKRAREAARNLKSAQAYHADEVCIVPRIPEARPQVVDRVIRTVPVIVDRSALQVTPSAQNFGRSIAVKMRSTLINDKGSKQTQEDLMMTKEHEPLQYLLDRYRKQKGLPDATKIVFLFEDGIMDMTKTPQFFDLDDDELIDVEYKTLADKTSQPPKPIPLVVVPSKKVDLGKRLRIKLRTVNGTKEIHADTLKTYANEPFQVLMNKYRKKYKIAPSKAIQFTFEDVLTMNQTPADVDMESDDTIDVKIKC